MVNGLVDLLLRAQRGGGLGRSLLLLTVTGRRTGRRYRFPVQYARDGDVLWIVVGDHRGKAWWRNLTAPAPVEVRLRGVRRDGEARAVEGGRFELAAVPSLEGTILRAALGGFETHVSDAPSHTDLALQIVLARPRAENGLVRGIVLDPAGSPVQGARVSAGGEVAFTDRAGEFAIDVTREGTRPQLLAVECRRPGSRAQRRLALRARRRRVRGRKGSHGAEESDEPPAGGKSDVRRKTKG